MKKQLILGSLLVCGAWVLLPSLAQTNSVPVPPAGDPPPPPLPVGMTWEDWTNSAEYAAGTLPAPETKKYRWVITFEHSETADFETVTTYPMTIEVPFEDETGFVRVRAVKQQVINVTASEPYGYLQ